MVDSALIIEGIKAVKATYEQIKKVKKLKPLSKELEGKMQSIALIFNDSIMTKITEDINSNGMKSSLEKLSNILNDSCAKHLIEVNSKGKIENIKKFFKVDDHIEQYKNLVHKLDGALIAINLSLNIKEIEMTHELQELALEQKHRDEEKSHQLDNITEKLDDVCRNMARLDAVDQDSVNEKKISQVIKMERKSTDIPPGFSIHLSASYAVPVASSPKVNSQNENCEEESWSSWFLKGLCCQQ